MILQEMYNLVMILQEMYNLVMILQEMYNLVMILQEMYNLVMILQEMYNLVMILQEMYNLVMILQEMYDLLTTPQTDSSTCSHNTTTPAHVSDRARISDFRYGGVSVGGQHARQCTKPVALLSASVSSPPPPS